MGVRDKAAKAYIHLPKKIRKRTDPLIPKSRQAGKQAGGFFQNRAAKGRKTVVEPLIRDARRLLGGKPRKKRRKRRKKR